MDDIPEPINRASSSGPLLMAHSTLGAQHLQLELIHGAGVRKAESLSLHIPCRDLKLYKMGLGQYP